MKLRVFHVGDGDCLLLESDDGHRVLVDGGRKTQYKTNVRAALGALRDAGHDLDLVCVSHIDDDHISGVLQLVQDELDWRVFEFRRDSGQNARAPRVERPPRIREVWHNALFQLVGEDHEVIVEETLVASAGLLRGSREPRALDLAARYENLATGERSSMELSRRLSDRQLGLSVNAAAGGDLILRGGPADVTDLGSLRLSVLGPSEDDLQALRDVWDAWIDANNDAVVELHDQMRADEEDLGTSAAVARAAGGLLATALGEGGITEPNLASIMLLAEEDDTSVLLTGDGSSEEILAGLGHHGKLDAAGRLHVTVLKLQHHAALANVTEDFVDRVTADHYVFCGNGAHHNPEKEVVEALAEVRLGLGGRTRRGPDRDFKLWFSSRKDTPKLSKSRKKHMKTIEETVDGFVAQSGGRMSAEFLKSGALEVL